MIEGGLFFLVKSNLVFELTESENTYSGISKPPTSSQWPIYNVIQNSKMLMIDWRVFPRVQQVADLRWRSQYRLQECSGTVSAILQKVEKNYCNRSEPLSCQRLCAEVSLVSL